MKTVFPFYRRTSLNLAALPAYTFYACLASCNLQVVILIGWIRHLTLSGYGPQKLNTSARPLQNKAFKNETYGLSLYQKLKVHSINGDENITHAPA